VSSVPAPILPKQSAVVSARHSRLNILLHNEHGRTPGVEAGTEDAALLIRAQEVIASARFVFSDLGLECAALMTKHHPTDSCARAAGHCPTLGMKVGFAGPPYLVKPALLKNARARRSFAT
jgi:hypothetical protein